MVQKSPHTENPQNNETLTEDLIYEVDRYGFNRNLLRKGLMAPGLTANWAFRWPLTHVTPSVFHADQHGMGPY